LARTNRPYLIRNHGIWVHRHNLIDHIRATIDVTGSQADGVCAGFVKLDVQAVSSGDGRVGFEVPQSPCDKCKSSIRCRRILHHNPSELIGVIAISEGDDKAWVGGVIKYEDTVLANDNGFIGFEGRLRKRAYRKRPLGIQGSCIRADVDGFD
jgi:hypothetical protein